MSRAGTAAVTALLGLALVGAACAGPAASSDERGSPTPATAAGSSADDRERPSSVRVADCQAAFERLPGEMRRLPRLDAAGPEVDGTFAACGDVETWLAAAQDTFALASPTLETARALLAARCADSVTLRGFDACRGTN